MPAQTRHSTIPTGARHGPGSLARPAWFPVLDMVGARVQVGATSSELGLDPIREGERLRGVEAVTIVRMPQLAMLGYGRCDLAAVFCERMPPREIVAKVFACLG